MDLTCSSTADGAHGEAIAPGSLATLVRDAALAYPEATALRFAGRSLAYRELDARSDAVARAVRQALAPRGPLQAIVGLHVPRGLEAIVGLIGIMKAGAAYLPLDPELPAARIAYMLEDSGAALVLGSGADVAGLTVLDLDEAMTDASAAEILPEPAASAAAYVIYTSGSTGQPKGTVIEHRGAVNLALRHRELFDLRPGAVGLQFASLGFDASVSEICSAFAAGATLVVAEDHERRDPGALLDLIERQRVNVATLPPSLLPHLPQRVLPDLRTLVVAGEVCAEREMRRWAEGRRLINAYGPTEATVCAAVASYRPGDPPARIGRALRGVTLHVLDEAGAPVPMGVEGELFIGGVGVARGYLNRPELTAERFVAGGRFGGGRAFRTGDRVRWLEPGVLEYRGRLDEQVKLAGQRIEPDEVARALERVEGVRQACVVVQEGEHGRRLVAFYVPGEPVPAVGLLEEALSRWLPSVMLPAAYVALAALPLTANGKIDRAALAVAPTAQPETAAPALTPMEEAVARIWCEVLELPAVRAEDNFYALGGDSLRMTQLLLHLNQTFGTMLVASRFRKLATLGDLAAHIERHAAAGAGR